MKYALLPMTFVFSAGVAQADELIIGLGYDDVLNQTGTQSVAAVFEYHATPFYSGRAAEYGFGIAAQIDTDGDVWVGAGIAAEWTVAGGPWFVEASLMPGYYDPAPGGTILGGNFHFRSLLGIGYAFNDGHSLSLAIDHKSNASIEDFNPGSETLVLRYTFDF